MKWEGRPFFSLLFQREQYVACTVLLLDPLVLLEPGISGWRVACFSFLLLALLLRPLCVGRSLVMVENKRKNNSKNPLKFQKEGQWNALCHRTSSTASYSGTEAEVVFELQECSTWYLVPSTRYLVPGTVVKGNPSPTKLQHQSHPCTIVKPFTSLRLPPSSSFHSCCFARPPTTTPRTPPGKARQGNKLPTNYCSRDSPCRTTRTKKRKRNTPFRTVRRIVAILGTPGFAASAPQKKSLRHSLRTTAIHTRHDLPANNSPAV